MLLPNSIIPGAGNRAILLVLATLLRSPLFAEGISATLHDRTLTLEAEIPAEVTRVELRLHSDRNAAVSKFTDVSPLAPKSAAAPRMLRAEIWYPVVDVVPADDAEAVARFDPAPAALYSVNGLVVREKAALGPEIAIPARRLEHWENAIWIEPSTPRLQEFYLRRRFEARRHWRTEVEVLTPQWSGTASLHAIDAQGAMRELGRVRVSRAGYSPTPIRGSGMERTRLLASLAATVDYTVRSYHRNPASAFDDGLQMFYDLDAGTYRSVHWIWGYGPSVKLLLDAAQIPEIAARHPPGELRRIAEAVGRMTLAWAERSPVDMLLTSRWERHPDYEYGHRQALTPADGGFIMGWAWLPLYETTGDERYLTAAKRLADSLAHLCREWAVVPQNLWMDCGHWGDAVIDESGFGTEGLAELYRITGDPRYRELGIRYMQQLLAKLERPDGLWDRAYNRGANRRTPTAYMTRGLGWAMEGLLANHRLDPSGPWLKKASAMGEHLLRAQRSEGYWTVRFDQPAEQVGKSDKGTALWSLLFYRAYQASNDPRHRTAAQRALAWCLDEQYAGPDREAHGSIVCVSPTSGVGYRPWFRVSCLYTSGFFGLAVLEELRASGAKER